MHKHAKRQADHVYEELYGMKWEDVLVISEFYWYFVLIRAANSEL